MKDVFLYLGLGMLFTHEMDAMPNHEWRVFPLLGSLPDAIGQFIFLAVHIPIFALVIAFVASLNQKVRDRAQKIAAGFLIAHAALHFMFSGQANYEFSSFFSSALILGAALCGIGFFSAVALERSSSIS
ncbi:MAG: DUF6713 family protein [Woeseiaceae bacterium]|jgi:hypothetical protein